MSLIDNNFDYEKLISDALLKKSKRVFADNERQLTKLVRKFSPAYRDFILKVISNSALNISYGATCYIIPSESGNGFNATKFTKKMKNKIYVNVYSSDGLIHELGHSVDFTFGIANALTLRVIIKNNKTFFDIFTKEFESTYQEIYSELMREYKHIIDSSIHEGAYDLLIKYMPTYQKLISIPCNYTNKENTKQRAKLQDELYKCGFVETYYQFRKKNCHQMLSLKYGPVLDALSSKFDFNGLNLPCHNKDYYKRDEYRPVFEFFANAFEAN